MPSRRSAVPAAAAPIAALALAALLAAPCAAQTTTPIPSTFFAISPVHVGDFPPLAIGTAGHPPFVWTWVEASRGSFDFTRFDGFVSEAQAHGLYDSATHTVRMAITLGLTPSWAVANQTTCTHGGSGGLMQCAAPPDSISDWTDLLTHLIDHYNGIDAPHIQYYELWNEANDDLWWTPPPGDTTYATLAAMARIAYPIIHRDPVSQLLTPSVAGKIDKQATWMAGYLKAGGAQYADVGVYHGYLGANATNPFPMPEEDGGFGSIITRTTRMRAVFDTCGLAGKPMMMTEGSWGNMNVTDPDAQAAWLARYMLLQAGLRSTNHLEMVSWFCWADSAFGWGNLETRTGMPNLAAVAYSTVYGWVVGATLAAPFSGGADGTWVGTITRSGGYVGKVVWNTQGPATYMPPGPNFTRYRDLAGHTFPITAGATVPIGAQPVLVEKGTSTAAVPADVASRDRLRIEPSVMRASARIEFGAALGSPGRVEVLDALGRTIRALPVEARSTSVVWDGRAGNGRRAADGVYWVRLVSPGRLATGRVAVDR